MKLKWFCLLCLFLVSPMIQADEGMWLLSQLNKSTCKTMKRLGLKIRPSQIYNPSQPSMKDAIVSFGGFCSGVVVSSEGLVLTNHHCGLNSVQQHSSLEHNYLEDGFIAHSYKEELPNPDLYVRFLVYTKDVTKRVLRAVRHTKSEQERHLAVDSISDVIEGEVSRKDSTLKAVVDAYYGGSEYSLTVYRDYTDVRLVFAPPSSVGQFGWDTDNWVWPRHTGDFCVFRIYAGKNNMPADYSPDNVPYRPSYVAPISLGGYKEGSFCMTLGYPGSTERYLSSFGVDEMAHHTNQAVIDIRGLKLDVWKQAMNADEDLRIKYASKYSESSNYWKNSVGMNKAITQLGILDKRKQIEAMLKDWARRKGDASEERLLQEMAAKYKDRAASNRALAYYSESLFEGSELMQFAMSLINFDFNGEEKQVVNGLKDIVAKYKNYDADLDRKVFKMLVKKYQATVSADYLPHFYKQADSLHITTDAMIDSLYDHSEITSIRGLQRFLNRDTTYNIMKDPAIEMGIDLIMKYMDIDYAMHSTSTTIEKDERLLTADIRAMYDDRHFYPDANSTMRLSYGSVAGYNPNDGVRYNYYTTAKGILEKVQAHQGDHDFRIKPELLKLIHSGDFGKYADKDGSMKVCFISNNDITGGNSGSAMFNDKGELIGLAFDGNWEAMSSDLRYEPQLQRCIGVDIRYVLFLIDKYGKAGNLMNELTLRQ